MDKLKCLHRNPGNAGRCAKQQSKQTYSRKRKRHNKLPKQNIVVEGVEEEVAEEILEEVMLILLRNIIPVLRLTKLKRLLQRELII